MFEILDRKIQLHQVVEIHYMVDGYDAIYPTTDGQREVCRANGKTVAEALQNLEELIRDYDIRKR